MLGTPLVAALGGGRIIIGDARKVTDLTVGPLTARARLASKASEVRDAEGRQRFHGAMTGGWSAGYYNTVGSAAGWAPTAWTSSRDKRAAPQTQQPSDFMDGEDDVMAGAELRVVGSGGGG